MAEENLRTFENIPNVAEKVTISHTLSRFDKNILNLLKWVNSSLEFLACCGREEGEEGKE